MPKLIDVGQSEIPERLLTMKQTKTNGFTLIEVMVTVVILSVLTAIAIPAYRGYIATARNAEGWDNLAAIRLAEEEFFLENNNYFFGADATALNGSAGSNGLWEAQPSKDNVFNFDYAVVSSGSGYVATATGKNNVDPSVVLTISK
jgi:type IV pilus assembly protein PilE